MTLQPIPLSVCSPNLLCASHYEWLMLSVKKLRRLICHHWRHNGTETERKRMGVRPTSYSSIIEQKEAMGKVQRNHYSN
jgi:hypothetical protein